MYDKRFAASRRTNRMKISDEMTLGNYLESPPIRLFRNRIRHFLLFIFWSHQMEQRNFWAFWVPSLRSSIDRNWNADVMTINGRPVTPATVTAIAFDKSMNSEMLPQKNCMRVAQKRNKLVSKLDFSLFHFLVGNFHHRHFIRVSFCFVISRAVGCWCATIIVVVFWTRNDLCAAYGAFTLTAIRKCASTANFFFVFIILKLFPKRIFAAFAV